MPTTKAAKKAVAKYVRTHYDDVKVRVEKGRREEIQSHATRMGESVNAFINRAIAETIERDNGTNGNQ